MITHSKYFELVYLFTYRFIASGFNCNPQAYYQLQFEQLILMVVSYSVIDCFHAF